ncbi:MAG: hypothetical protein WDA71_08705, partial [Actinomycetota bacterium]
PGELWWKSVVPYIHHTLPHAREQRRQVLEKYLNAFFAGEDEPICCRREEAVDCFLRTHMDAPARRRDRGSGR